MDYYKKFKPGPGTAIDKLAGSVKSLAEQIPRITKRLSDERNNSGRLKERIRDLEKRAGEILIDDKNAFEKYRSSLRKLNFELETSTSMIQSLSETLERSRVEFGESKFNLRVLLNAHLLEKRPVADARINVFLKECIAVVQEFLADFERIYADCGIDFIASSDDFYPGPWSGQQVGDMCIDLGIGIDKGDISEPTKAQDAPEPIQTPKTESTITNLI